MPIKPENKDRYPKDWKQIVARIKERDGNCCKWCKVPNGALIVRYFEGNKAVYQFQNGCMHDAENGKFLGLYDVPDGYNLVKIVLTTAHLNHIPEDCSDENLASLCQKCHLNYDHPRKMADRKAKKLQTSPELFTTKTTI